MPSLSPYKNYTDEHVQTGFEFRNMVNGGGGVRTGVLAILWPTFHDSYKDSEEYWINWKNPLSLTKVDLYVKSFGVELHFF